MKKSIKKCLIAMLSLSMVFALGFGVSKVNNVNAENATLPDNVTVDMYLIAGQSNAAGYSPKGAESQTFDNVWYVGETDKELAGSNANKGMGDYTTYVNVTAGQGANSNRIGPEYGMAKVLNEYYANTDTKALIFKSAAGGTSVKDTSGNNARFGNWYPRSLWGDTVNPAENGKTDPMGVQYYNFVENFKTVYTELKSEGYTPVVKGMVWMQGCADLVTPGYEDILKTFIDDIRADVYEITSEEADKTMPFIIGEISTGLKAGAESTKVQAFNVVQRNVANAKENAYTVSTEGLYIGSDGWHFITESAVTLGERFGKKIVEVEEMVPNADVFITGASVYVGEGTQNGVDKSGIRFQVLAKESLVKGGAEIGALLLPADMTTETKLEVDTTVIQNESVEGVEKITNELLPADKWFASEYEGYLQTCVYLYNFPVNDYNREILASAYVKSGEAYTYSSTISRSMAYVALAAENAGDDRAVGYIKSYHVNFYGEDGVTEIEGLENVGVRYGSIPTKPENPDDEVGKLFEGWYADKDCTRTFDFSNTIKGTTNIYTKWLNGYKVNPGAYQVLAGAPTAQAGEGFVVDFTLQASRNSGAYSNNGGLYVELGDGRTHKFTFNEEKDKLRISIYESRGNTYYNELQEYAYDVDNEDVDVKIVFYEGVYYIQFGTYTVTYSMANSYKWIQQANLFDTTQTRKIGVCGAMDTTYATIMDASTNIGNEAALTAIQSMGLTPIKAYSVNAGAYQVLDGAPTAQAGEGFAVDFTLKASRNSGAYFNNGGLYVELGNGNSHKITFNQNSGKLMISIWESTKSTQFNEAHEYAYNVDNEDVAVKIVFYNSVYYIKFGNYTVTYSMANNYSYIQQANLFDTTQTRKIGVCGAITTTSASFTGVTYKIGNEVAKAAAEAMRVTAAGTYNSIAAGAHQVLAGAPTAAAGEGFVVNFTLKKSANSGAYFNNGGLYVELGNGNSHKIMFNQNSGKLMVTIYESTKNTQFNEAHEYAYDAKSDVKVTIAYYNNVYYIKFGNYTVSYASTNTYKYINDSKLFDATQTRTIGVCGGLAPTPASFTGVICRLGNSVAKAVATAMGFTVA